MNPWLTAGGCAWGAAVVGGMFVLMRLFGRHEHRRRARKR
jgi:hypothetical protein